MGERNNEEDEESTGIICARISRQKTENEDGRRARWWNGTFLGNFIISGRQKASGTRRVPLNKRSPASIGLGLLKPGDPEN